MISQKITLDFCSNDYKTIRVKQYDKDSRNLIITCTNNGNVYKLNSSVHQCNVKMLTPDNRALYKTATINEDGDILVVFDEDMVHVGGTGKLDFHIFNQSTKQTVSTMILTAIIINSVYPDDVVIASNEFSALTEVLLNIDDSVKSVDENIDRMEKLEQEVTVAENTRKANETERQAKFEESVSNEEERISNESTRISNETNRQNQFEETISDLGNAIELCENAANEHALLSKSYAVGDTNIRENENIDNSKYYYEQTKRISQGVNGVVNMGTVSFDNLPTVDIITNAMYNISDEFTSDERFNDGGGVHYGAGNNVIWTSEGKWDVTASSSVSGIKGNAESSYRQGNVNITAENIGLGNVDNTSDINKPISNATQEALENKVSYTDIVDNLLSTSTNLPLSANQGKELHELLTTNVSTLNDDISSLDNNKANKSDLDSYVPKTGGTVNGNLTANRFMTDKNSATGVDKTAFNLAPFVSNASTNTNDSLRAGYGFHNAGVNGLLLYLDTDGRLRTINNTGTANTLAHTADVEAVKGAFTLSGTTLTINMDALG